MKPADFNIQTFIDELQGTCQSLDMSLPDGMIYEDLTDEDHQTIDNQIFLCPICGWWCEVSEANASESGEDVCNDCKSDEEE